MQETGNTKTGKLTRGDAPDALHQLLFAWGKRWWGAPAAVKQPEGDANLIMHGHSATISPMVMGNVSLSNWQQQTLTQLGHALTLALSKKGRDTDASYVMHLQSIQRAGEISFAQCLERLERLCPGEMGELPLAVRAKLASIKIGIH